MSALPRYVLLAGGVGGAKLALGLARTLQPGQLTIIANTGDDFTHLGLSISPDLDTLMYTLADVVNEATGWGLRDETWSCMAGLAALGAETWFRLGDRDLATHLERTRLLAAGHSLTEVTQQLCSRLGVGTRLLPMSDLPVRTLLDCDTAAGPATLSFQDYFVRQRAEPRVRAIHYQGASQAPPAATLAAALTDPDLAAIFIAPSNPWLSIDPILAIPSIRAAVRSSHAPVVAVSPDRRWPGAEGSDREDHDRTRPAALGAGGRTSLPGSARRFHPRPGRCRRSGRDHRYGHRGGRDADRHAHAGRPAETRRLRAGFCGDALKHGWRLGTDTGQTLRARQDAA